jgi:hypothetical protein
MSNQGYGRNPRWSPEFTGRTPSFNDMGAMWLNPNHPLNKGLVAWWLMNERAGNKLCDIINISHVVGTINYSNIAGQNAINCSVNSASNSNLCLSVDYSVRTVVYRPGGNDVGILAKWIPDGTYRSYSLYIYYDLFRWTTSSDGTFGTAQNVDGTFVSNNAWNDYLIVKQGSVVSMYANGKLVGTGTGINNTFINNTALVIGNSIGYVNDLQFYKRALTSKEVADIASCAYGTPSNPRFLVMPQRTWFVPAAGGGALTYSFGDDASSGMSDAILGMQSHRAVFGDNLEN